MSDTPLLEGISSGVLERFVLARMPIGVDLLEAIGECGSISRAMPSAL